MILSKNDVEKLQLKYPGTIPIIISKDATLKYKWYSKDNNDLVKILAYETTTMFDFKLKILAKLKSLNYTVTDTIYISCGGTILNSNNIPLSYIAERYAIDGALYMKLHGENAFG